MGEGSAIEWTDHTFNPWIGCTKVSPACDHCYAEILAHRFKLAEWGPGKPRRLAHDDYWKQPVAWNRKAEKAGVRHRVFCASLADVFDNEVPQVWRERLWDLIEATPHLDWLLLTKRIGNATKMMPGGPWRDGWPNVWLGASIVNQEEADRDIPKLLATPASIRFLSMEPLLGPVDLEVAWHGESALDPECWGDCAWCKNGLPPLHNCQMGKGDYERGRSGVDWVIVGGESGPHARPMHPDWARSLRDQCAAAGVPYFFKQWGEWVSVSEVEGDGPHFEFPDYARVRRIGKKGAGRLLDGREWSEYPLGPSPAGVAA